MDCIHCGRREADAHDYKTLPEGEGKHLCWGASDPSCVPPTAEQMGKCRRDGCPKEALPYPTYGGACSLYCRDMAEEQEEHDETKARIASLERALEQAKAEAAEAAEAKAEFLRAIRQRDEARKLLDEVVGYLSPLASSPYSKAMLNRICDHLARKGPGR